MSKGPKISVITACYNSANTIADTMASVASQSYDNIEHIVVDGLSKDKTIEVVERFPHVAQIIQEKDKGMYDAINKGINASTGDIVGILNSDDFFTHDEVLKKVSEAFESKNIESVFGDVKFVSPEDPEKVVRYYSCKGWEPRKFGLGYMPAHPTFYARKECFDKYGDYQIDYKICADYELVIRFLHTNRVTYKYIDDCMVTMRAGGISNEGIKSRITLNKEIVRACRENGIKTNLLKLGLMKFTKIKEFINLGND